MPIIARDYHRLKNRRLVDDQIRDGVLTKGNVSGFGDVTLIGLWRPWSYVDEHAVVRFTLLGGIKMPSGDPGKLVEEQKLRRATEAGGGCRHLGHVVRRRDRRRPRGRPPRRGLTPQYRVRGGVTWRF